MLLTKDKERLLVDLKIILINYANNYWGHKDEVNLPVYYFVVKMY